MDLARALPLVLTLGGAGLVAKGGGRVAERVIYTVKVVMTRSELSQVANLLDTDSVLGQRLPRGDKAFAAWLRENMQARSGRDPALDLWQVPYQLGRDGKRLVVRSAGPNQTRDSCSAGRDEAHDVEVAVAAQRAATNRPPAQGAATSSVGVPDDVCVEVFLTRGGKGGVDPMLGSDSPFRRMPSTR